MKARRWLLAGAVLVPLAFAFAAGAAVLLMRQGGLAPFRVPTSISMPISTPEAIERGRYLATLGNCAGCHTAQGGAAMAGGRAFRTRYGTVYSSNITPDPQHGIGAWSRDEFRHAMRHGVSRNGVLSPVFPYASFRQLSDDDLDAVQVYLLALEPSAHERRAPQYEFPANLPGAMVAWRLLYYRPAPARGLTNATSARGAYLVEGIGHCATCHGSRGTFASQAAGWQLWGARNAGWYAPPLHGAGLQRFAEGHVAKYLQGGAPNDIATFGLMADVVAGNLQHLTAEDAVAIETHLRELPAPPPPREPPIKVRATASSLALGRDVYAKHCADCHGDEGQGIEGKYPALVASTAITSDDPINLVKLVLFGGVAPTTARNPSPYTMPPFSQALRADEAAAVVNFLRIQSNAEAVPVSEDDIRAMGGID